MRQAVESFEPRASGLIEHATGALVGDSYFREIIERLPTAVYSTDADGRIVFYNEAAAALWGR